MKLDNVARVFRYTSMDMKNIFFTILMDYSPWRIYCGHEFSAPSPSDPASLRRLKSTDFNEMHFQLPNDDGFLESLFDRFDVKSWRRAEDVFTKEELPIIMDGSSISFFHKRGSKINEINFTEQCFPTHKPFPEFVALTALLAYLEFLVAGKSVELGADSLFLS